MQNLILDHQQITNKLRRIALQILETQTDEDEIVLAGISNKGYIMSGLLQNMIAEYSEIKTTLCKIYLDKKNIQGSVSTTLSEEKFTNKYVVVIDDVLHSGTTLIYAVKYFLDVPLSKLKTAVLVNRNHKKYPIKADFKGLSLSTSINEHVEVSFETNNYQAVLV